jgi:hypothetical protein
MERDLLILQIPEPCNESWLKMESTLNGRSCAKCQKEVFDLTSLSDDRIIDLLLASGGKICGRLNKQQLAQPFTAIHSGSRLTLPALVLAAATLTQEPAYGQQPAVSPTVAATETAIPDSTQLPPVTRDTLSQKPPITVTQIDLSLVEEVRMGDIVMDKKTMRKMRKNRRRSTGKKH